MDDRSRRADMPQEGRGTSDSRRLSPSNSLLYVAIVLLVVAVLLLPPISLVTRLQERGFTRLEPGAAALISPDGLSLAAASPAPNGSNLAVKVSAVSSQAFQEGQAGDAWNGARQALPSYLTLKSPIYEITAQGSTDAKVQLSVAIPKDAGALQTLDLYTWDGAAWHWLPGHVDQAQGVITSEVDRVPGAVAVMQSNLQPVVTSAEAGADEPLTDGAEATLNEVYPLGLRLGQDGALEGQVEDIAWTGKANLLPMVRNYGQGVTGDTLTAVLTDQASRQRQVAALAQAATGYTGIVLDYQGLDPSLRDAYTSFVRDAATALHAQGFQLGIVVGPAVRSGTTWNTGGYDWRALGAAADFLLIPGPDDPVAYDVDGAASDLLSWAVGEVDRRKIMFLVSASSLDQAGAIFAPVTDETALRSFGQVASEPISSTVTVGTPVPVTIKSQASQLVFDEAAMTYRYDYESGGQRHTVWLSTPSALAQRLRWVGVYNLRGVALRDLLRGTGAAARVAALAQILKSAQLPPASAPAVVWTIRDPSGRVVTQTTTLDNSRLDVSAGEPGAYSVGAAIGDTTLGQVSIQVAAAATATPAATETPTGTPTNTPKPTATPRPTNTPGPSPTPAPTNTAGPTSPPAPTQPPPPPPPSGGGSFELGGQVINFSRPDLMLYSGMWWVKRQSKYSLGDDPGGVKWMIDQAHGAGFKILLSIPGEHPEQVLTPGFFDQYAGFLAGVASLGADGIEVWNEMNLNGWEWPAGQISAASYVQMLAKAYAAIKAANPNVLVVSGAPSPTGYYGGSCTPNGCDDAPYLTQMVQAGALNYADCVGIHYNEGILSPDATSGDPRGNSSFYTRYYWGMVNTYWSIIGGARKLCFTELGYLSGEGWGPLPPNFAWAGSVTVADQAAWLARAAQLSRDSGKVRLMIIWNVDSTQWGDDPQAGYAMIRRDGSCPACDQLHATIGGR